MAFEMTSAEINQSMGCVEMRFGDHVQRARLSALQRKVSKDQSGLRNEAAYLVAKALRDARVAAGLEPKVAAEDVNEVARTAMYLLIQQSGVRRGV